MSDNSSASSSLERDAGLAQPLLLTIIIPAFNCEKTLGRTVESTDHLPSTLALELVVIDDGSTDDTARLIAELGRSRPWLHGIRQLNAGLSGARNTGIRQAQGEYILLLDGDDELCAGSISHLFEGAPDMIRIGVEEIVDGQPPVLHHEPAAVLTGKAYLQQHFRSKTFYTPSCAYIYRREWLLQNGLSFFPRLLHEDMLFTVEALLQARTLAVSPLPLYRYIRRPGSITTAAGNHRLKARSRALLFVARRLLRLAALHRDVDMRWWIEEVIHNSAALGLTQHGRLEGLRVVWAHLLFMATYRGFGGHGFRYEQRQRLRKIVQGWLRGRYEG